VVLGSSSRRTASSDDPGGDSLNFGRQKVWLVSCDIAVGVSSKACCWLDSCLVKATQEAA